MTGRKTGRRGKRVRYYAVSRGTSVPVRGSILKRLIPAEPIERAVVAALRNVLIAKGELRQTVEQMVREQTSVARLDDADVAKLRKQREKAAAKLSFVIDELDEIGRDVAKAKIAQLQAQLRALDEQISSAKRNIGASDLDAETITTAVVDQLSDLAQSIHELPPTAVRRVVQLLVAKLEVDLETRVIELELRLPTWAIGTADAIRTACASATDLHAGEPPRHTALGAILALLDCERQKQGRSVCYGCTRRRAA